MSARPILFDTTRLLTRLKHPSPSGIDRVDVAYASRFLLGAPGSEAVAGATPTGEALAITPFGARIMPEALTRRLLGGLARQWGNGAKADRDPILRDLEAALASRAITPPREPPRRRLRSIDIAAQISRLRTLAWRRAATAARDAIYLHASHLRLDLPERFEWLVGRPDIRSVFFVHDLIPIECPEYVVPGEDARHRVRMATVARHAAVVMVNSVDVKGRLSAYLASEGLRVPPIAVAPLAVEPHFLAARRMPDAGRPFFVICSTIEARKNHLLLLQVWRDIVGRLGADAPALVIVGRRGWESEAAVDLLDRCPALRGHVFEAGGLSTPALAALVGRARALLMPSFAEGYGIPVVEALSIGTPVVASDIPVFREIAGEHAILLHPLDGPGWTEAILRLAAEPNRGVGQGSFVVPTWGRHFEIVADVLANL